MTQKIQAYFKSEDGAEKAAARLRKVNVSNVLVDKIPDEGSPDRLVLVPALNSGTTGSAAPGNPAAVGGGVDKLKDMITRDENKDFSHILEFEVDKNNVDEAMDELRQTEEAYIDENVLDGNSKD
ncbi:hypothetical protein [Salipaludibacillus aurantiacus]|uniref:Heat induced stress protein YflT n=1 Tax=Salipaludibacillus aurantiacus TaxID=1601833 RepID=A0A1H9WJZ0_9BACI|nr:hypothetical protein [Salipaludibacillus aurantiacus]SES33763.1 hypothetical protein SAMN05518684_11750 [Salipaludibacillus aurantiacus]